MKAALGGASSHSYSQNKTISQSFPEVTFH